MTTTADDDQRCWRRARNDVANRERRGGRREAKVPIVSAFDAAVFSVGVVPNKPMVPTAATSPATSPPRSLRRHIGQPLEAEAVGGSVAEWILRTVSEADGITRVCD